MAKQKRGRAPKMGTGNSGDISSYEVMGLRIRNEILSPGAQLNSSIRIYKLDSESWDDWDRFVDEIQTNEEVTLSHISPGAVSLSWDDPNS
ncbi:DUF1654 domain-containing protein [Carnimonas bestiolae]|uniref:DUF1654 domain-containing protein n=1 Tax=Carnimonas bestiolae TaxID=3402172 RepID=UPI003EDC8A89